MSNIPKPEDEKNLEFDIRYQPDMVLSGSLDATEPVMNYLQLSLGDEVYDLNRQLPDYSEASNGDVLQIDDGAPVWAEMPEELPSIGSGDAGKVLTVNAGETGVEWDSVDALPTISAGDAGKVLTVNSGETGTEWAEPSGGVVPDLSDLETAILTAASAACANAETSGYQGVSISLFGTETTVANAELVNAACLAGKFTALGYTFTITCSSYETSAHEVISAVSAIDFDMPLYAADLTHVYSLVFHVANGTARDQADDTYHPTLAVSCIARKIANYPSNS